MAKTKTAKNKPAKSNASTTGELQGRERTSGPRLEPHQIILRPMVTEKGMFQSQNNNQYTFEVNPYATKTEIKNAIETLFDVKVAKVLTQNRLGKPRRYRFRYGRTKSWKKAIVKLAGDHRIDFF